MNVDGAKAIALVSLFSLCAVFGFLPRALIPAPRRQGESIHQYVARSRKWYHISRRIRKKVISFVGCFAGGVFLATLFLDLLPDVIGDYHDILQQLGCGNSSSVNGTTEANSSKACNFAWAEFNACVGFFFILSIEQLVLFAKESGGGGGRREGSLDSRTVSLASETDHLLPTPRRSSTLGNLPGIVEPLSEHFNGELPRLEPPEQDKTRSRTISLVNDQQTSQNDTLDTLREDAEDALAPSKLRSAILLLALSVHSVFEGLTVGLLKTQQEVFEVLTALVLHKCVIAFSLGVSVVQADMSLMETALSIGGFSIASPAGIAIGIVVATQQSLAATIVSTVLQGMACGTFVYITFFEVLPIEFNNRRWRLAKLIFLFLGFATMALLIGLMAD